MDSRNDKQKYFLQFHRNKMEKKKILVITFYRMKVLTLKYIKVEEKYIKTRDVCVR